ncbi:MAG: endonuclease domain-containing protein [Gammaproteobacteria bacterium]
MTSVTTTASRTHYLAQLLPPSERPAIRPAIRNRVAPGKRDFARKLRKRPTCAEALLWSHLRQRQLLGAKFRRQVIIYGWIVDFYCPEIRLVVEVDGSSHDQRQLQDQYRDRVMIGAGFSVLRLSNELVTIDLVRSMTYVLGAITYCRGP